MRLEKNNLDICRNWFSGYQKPKSEKSAPEGTFKFIDLTNLAQIYATHEYLKEFLADNSDNSGFLKCTYSDVSTYLTRHDDMYYSIEGIYLGNISDSPKPTPEPSKEK